jgi:hypothetical protein
MRRFILLDDALETLRRAGLEATVDRGAPHFKIKFTNTHGSACVLIISRTPSSRRAIFESRSVLRRLLQRSPT